MRITLFYVTTPCILVDRYLFSEIFCFRLCSTFKTKVTAFSETSLLFKQTTQRNILENNICLCDLYVYGCIDPYFLDLGTIWR
jgi:hypothetical protein